MMESRVEYCYIHQIDLQTALLHADEIEHDCGARCPFSRQFRELRTSRSNNLFQINVTPDVALEGTDITISWSYQGSTNDIEDVSLNLLSATVRPRGQITIKADKNRRRALFTLKRRGMKPTYHVCEYQVLPLPVIRIIDIPKIVPRNTRVIVSAAFENHRSATLVYPTGERYGLTSGTFTISSLTRDLIASIEVIGRYGGKTSAPISIRVFDPPIISFFSPWDSIMTAGKVSFGIRTSHVHSAILKIRNTENVIKNIHLDEKALEKGLLDGINLTAGTWTAQLTVYNLYGHERKSSCNFKVVDPLYVQIGRGALHVFLACTLVAMGCGLVYLCWPVLEFIWMCIVSVCGLVLAILEGIVDVIVYVATHVWVWVVAFIIWLLAKIG
jgi:hypothetical protein